jgi:hypothetical protein
MTVFQHESKPLAVEKRRQFDRQGRPLGRFGFDVNAVTVAVSS